MGESNSSNLAPVFKYLKGRRDIFHLTLIPSTSPATPTTRPASTPGKTTVASTTLRIQEVQVTHS